MRSGGSARVKVPGSWMGVVAICALGLALAGGPMAGATTSSTAPAATGHLILGPATGPAKARFGDKGVLTYGSASFYGSPTAPLSAPIVSMAASPSGDGYWLVGATGEVYSYGDATYHGGTQALHVAAPIIDIAPTPDGQGYWLTSASGSVFAFGDAHNFGSLAGAPSQYAVVGMAATPDGGGYWLVTSHGQVYSFGDATYYGSLGRTNLHDIPVVAIASSVDGRGYWLVQGGGEVIPYGDAPRLGGLRGHPPVSGIAVTSDGQGYWLVCGNGEVDSFGDATYRGGNSHADPRPPITDIVASAADGGYWLLDSEAFAIKFPTSGATRARAIVSVAASQLGPSPDGGNYCNPYGPCEEWCALFATWVWERAGVPIPRYPFVGSAFDWAARHTKVLKADQRPAPGDLVFYGTGPQNVATSPHMGIVAQVWPDGAIDTVEGDAGPGPGNWTSVLVNGPYFPSQSYFANGVPIYGYAEP